MADLNVTEAALWSEDFFNQTVQWLDDAGLGEYADQARGARSRGEAGLEEWNKIEEAAGHLSGDVLARVGKGPHLLEEGYEAPPPAPEEPPTEPQPEENP